MKRLHGRLARLLSATALLIAATTGAACAAEANPSAPGQLLLPQAGYYRIQVGNVEVLALSDGTAPLAVNDGLLLNAKTGEVDRLLASYYQTSPVDVSVTSYLFRLPGHVVLIDAGAGTLIGPTANKLPLGLAAAGLKREDITDIFLTHIHPDHIGGLLVDGKVAFPNATVHVNQKDVNYWFDPANAEKASSTTRPFFGATGVLKAYVDAGKVKPFDDAVEFFPGMRSQPAYGHTPGHSFYVLESQGQRIVFWGDLVHITAVQFDDPEVAIGFDTDPTKARATRRAAFADAEKGGYLVAAPHLDYPGIGRLRREGNHYRWIPVVYRNDAVAK